MREAVDVRGERQEKEEDATKMQGQRVVGTLPSAQVRTVARYARVVVQHLSCDISAVYLMPVPHTPPPPPHRVPFNRSRLRPGISILRLLRKPFNAPGSGSQSVVP